eukprot:scaffold84830_cov64-Phaeocystis_antarctica.AAC.4
MLEGDLFLEAVHRQCVLRRAPAQQLQPLRRRQPVAHEGAEEEDGIRAGREGRGGLGAPIKALVELLGRDAHATLHHQQQLARRQRRELHAQVDEADETLAQRLEGVAPAAEQPRLAARQHGGRHVALAQGHVVTGGGRLAQVASARREVVTAVEVPGPLEEHAPLRREHRVVVAERGERGARRAQGALLVHPYQVLEGKGAPGHIGLQPLLHRVTGSGARGRGRTARRRWDDRRAGSCTASAPRGAAPQHRRRAEVARWHHPSRRRARRGWRRTRGLRAKRYRGPRR